MIALAANPITHGSVALAASFLMVAVGVGTKQLRWRTVQCRVCGRPRGSCECRWL
jgi:hypothetical protein